MEPDASWTTAVYSRKGDSNTAVRLRNTSSTWDSICGIEKDLRLMGIDIHTLMHRNEEDNRWEWEIELTKLFSVRSLRRLIDGIDLPTAARDTDWCRWILSKVNIHIWRIFLNRLATKDNLSKRGIVALNSKDCPLCLTAAECLVHTFVRCSTTKIVTAHLENWVDWWPKNVSSTHEMWSLPSFITRDKHRYRVCKVIIAAFCWTIWLQRNRKLFNGSCKKEKDIFREIQFLAFDWIRCRSKFGKLLIWESWVCNPVEAAFSCNSLAFC